MDIVPYSSGICYGTLLIPVDLTTIYYVFSVAFVYLLLSLLGDRNSLKSNDCTGTLCEQTVNYTEKQNDEEQKQTIDESISIEGKCGKDKDVDDVFFLEERIKRQEADGIWFPPIGILGDRYMLNFKPKRETDVKIGELLNQLIRLGLDKKNKNRHKLERSVHLLKA